MAQKPTIPKGTRDFSPEEVSKRNYIFSSIKHQFQQFGFQPIETPSFENSDTLMGKYGEEGDRLIFKILNSGDFLRKSEDLLRYKVYLDEVLNYEYFFEKYNDNIKSLKGLESSKNYFDNLSPVDDESLKIVVLQIFLDIKHKIDDFRIQKFDKQNLKVLLDKNELDVQEAIYDIFFSIKFFEKNRVRSNINMLITKVLTGSKAGFSQSYSLQISEKALRYDLTVPFARYVVQHQNEIEFPFKRYQIQPVWRADRPQKGRFREFYQCDADVVGSDSLWQEVEFVQLYDAVFTALGLEGITIKINNRKILSGFAEVIGESDKLIDFTVALDKLDKIGEEGVVKEMQEKGISAEAIKTIQPIFSLTGDFSTKIEGLKEILTSSEEGKKGIEELEFIQRALEAMPLATAKLDLDVTLARGLNYYTGAIFEVAAPEKVKMGSIGGGGRYDDLTGIFGLKNMSGVGISFGLDRIYLVLEELGLFPASAEANTQVIFINFGEKEALYAMKAVKELRTQHIAAEMYPDAAKMKKQMNHANKRNISFVVLAGTKEMEEEKYTLKNMKTGEQSSVSLQEMIKTIS
ncbi:MAG: histidine--tRNA ligase [Mesonia sp.]|uniref:histidine--tRNA ligase n=1 Tax=Mesonia sp. TaxID=1960830 RepID=UPI003F95E48A